MLKYSLPLCAAVINNDNNNNNQNNNVNPTIINNNKNNNSATLSQATLTFTPVSSRQAQCTYACCYPYPAFLPAILQARSRAIWLPREQSSCLRHVCGVPCQCAHFLKTTLRSTARDADKIFLWLTDNPAVINNNNNNNNGQPLPQGTLLSEPARLASTLIAMSDHACSMEQ